MDARLALDALSEDFAVAAPDSWRKEKSNLTPQWCEDMEPIRLLLASS